MLIIFGGLPGSGKSTIAAQLSQKIQAFYLRIDSIEQALRDTQTGNDIGPEGYLAAYAIARDNLRHGFSVIADSVNPIELTRHDWRSVATDCQQPYIEVEICCSDAREHRRRVETRTSTIAGLPLPSWQAVCDREYEAWNNNDLTIDTAKQSAADAVASIIQFIAQKEASKPD